MSLSEIPPKADGFLKQDILGLQIHSVDAPAVHAFIAKTVRERGKALVLNLNVHCVSLALEQKWLFDFINRAHLVFCDGDGVRWGLKIFGCTPPPKITYDRWIWQLAEFCAHEGFSLYFLGAKPEVAEEAARRILERFPSLKIVGCHHGYFSKEGAENDQMVRRINDAHADILVTGFGMPIQEKWLLENWERVDARIFLTGGAVFDYAAGNFKRAPGWMIKMNLEWLFRMLHDPKRLFARYMGDIPYFFYRVFKEKLRSEK